MSQLKQRIAAMIRASGPMPVSAYMETCLHDPAEGYYATRPGLGEDFITAPEISQVFGELLGLWAAHEWQAMGSPEAFGLIELGPGRGTLMADALRASQIVHDFHKGLFLDLVEASPALQEVQAERLDRYAPDFKPSLSHITTGHSIILANEYLDCLPARQFVNTGTVWHERVIGLNEDGELSFGLAADRAPPPGLVNRHKTQITELQPGLDVLVDTLKARLENGDTFRALFIDYGPINHAPGDTLRAYKQGKQVDPLTHPGTSDLTVDVDFGRLKRLAEAAGLTVHGPIPQGALLMQLGVEARMQALIKSRPDQAETIYQSVQKLVDPTEMGQRFNAICISGPDLPVPAGF